MTSLTEQKLEHLTKWGLEIEVMGKNFRTG